MKRGTENIMYYVTCCQCGHKICKSTPCTLTQLDCPKCKAALAYQVDGSSVKVVVLNTKEQRRAAAGQ